jgi:NADH-quinone oxidoreductase subunit L
MHRAYHATHSHEDAQDMRNMGGLRTYMPTTFVLMWIATLAIAGIPPFAGFFSKDEILGSVYTRARTASPLADVHLFGITGRSWLFAIYLIGLTAALLTAIYMTRMMLYTFHGANRTGDEERKHLREAPAVMTVPLMVLGALSVFGGWLNLPALVPLGPVGVLHRWLEPVVGEGTARVAGGEAELGHGTEWALIGVAVAIAVVGIAFALARLKPAALVPKAQAREEEGIERVLEHKYYVDELYDAAVVKPIYVLSKNVLWRGIDAGLIDGVLVNGSAALARLIGRAGSALQSGQVATYAWVLLLGVVALLGAFTLR